MFRILVLCAFLAVLSAAEAKIQRCSGPRDCYTCCPLKFELFVRENSMDIGYNVNVDNLNDVPSFNFNNLVVYLSDYSEDADKPIVSTLKTAYLNQGDVFMVVNWSRLAKGEWFEIHRRSIAWDNTLAVGSRLAELLINMETMGLNASSIHLVGLGMGANIAGAAGNAFTELHENKQIGRITGLSPIDFSVDELTVLSTESAQFVDIIHTCHVGEEKVKRKIGHVDFYVNKEFYMKNAFVQPGCLLEKDGCSHRRAVELWAESVTLPCTFIAKECDGDQYGFMGQNTDFSLRGSMCLSTNNEAPFGKGPATQSCVSTTPDPVEPEVEANKKYSLRVPYGLNYY